MNWLMHAVLLAAGACLLGATVAWLQDAPRWRWLPAVSLVLGVYLIAWAMGVRR